MAIDKINTYANDDTNILAVQTTADQLIINRTSVSLTNMTDTTLPVVAAGSYFDCGGTLYKVGTDTTPSGTPTDNATCYIMATPAVDGLTATLSFTNTAPTWNDSKQGWYGTAGNAGNVYLPIRFYRSGTVYYDKHQFANNNAGYITRTNGSLASYTNSAQYTVTGTGEVTGFNTKLIDTGTYLQSNRLYLGAGGLFNACISYNINNTNSTYLILQLYTSADAATGIQSAIHSSNNAGGWAESLSGYAAPGYYIRLSSATVSNQTIDAYKMQVSLKML